MQCELEIRLPVKQQRYRTLKYLPVIPRFGCAIGALFSVSSVLQLYSSLRSLAICDRFAPNGRAVKCYQLMVVISSAGVGRAGGTFCFSYHWYYKHVAPNGDLSLLINKLYKFNQIVSPLGRHGRMSVLMGSI